MQDYIFPKELSTQVRNDPKLRAEVEVYAEASGTLNHLVKNGQVIYDENKKKATGIRIIDALVSKTEFLKSNGEARRAIKENSISVNKQKVNEKTVINKVDLIAEKYILLQRGKKNYFIITVV